MAAVPDHSSLRLARSAENCARVDDAGQGGERAELAGEAGREHRMAAFAPQCRPDPRGRLRQRAQAREDIGEISRRALLLARSTSSRLGSCVKRAPRADGEAVRELEQGVNFIVGEDGEIVVLLAIAVEIAGVGGELRLRTCPATMPAAGANGWRRQSPARRRCASARTKPCMSRKP